MKRFCGAWLLALASLFVFVQAAEAAEEITSFLSEVTLQTDGSVDVTETLDVRAEGIEIRRGIYRDIPTTMRNDDGTLLRASLQVHEVARDGQDEPYQVEGLDNGYVRIRIGNAEQFISRGPHRYVIRYTLTRMARTANPEHDELFWNATGNYWVFPIREATARITLPEGAVIADLIGYTGTPGSTEQAVTIERTGDNTATITTTRSLRSGEGMSVAALFQKGILVAPGFPTNFAYWLSDQRGVIVPLLAAVLVLGYFGYAWNKVGRDPAKGTIIPLFHPPKGFSPALVHFIHNMGWKQEGWIAFTASIFDLGVRGLATIETAGKTLTMHATGKTAEDLPRGEAVLFDYLRSEGTVKVGKSTGPTLNTKRAAFISAIEGENRARFFNNNVGYSILGAALAIAALLLMLWLDVLSVVWLVIAIVVGIGIGLLTTAIGSKWKGSNLVGLMVLVWIGLGATNVLGSASSLLLDFDLNMGAWAAMSITITTLVFFWLLRAPTVQGRKVMDSIEGFKMYLETAEKERLNLVDEPPLTVSRFEAILPYAIALGVEKPWSRYFESELARNAVPDAANRNYSPHWYRGSSFSAGKISTAMSSAAASMSAAMVAAQPVSSSSSGFSGSRSSGSGGGGGGGGGGGW